MLSFQLSHDIAGEWKHNEKGWFCGTSFIRPFMHPIIKSFHITHDAGDLFIIMEVPPQMQHPLPAGSMRCTREEYEDIVAAVRAWEYSTVMVTCTRGHAVIEAGAQVTAPVYIVSHQGSLYGDWDLPVLYPKISKDTLINTKRLLSFLNNSFIYSPEHILAGVVTLTERLTVRFDYHTVEIVPPAAGPLIKTELESSDELIESFSALLDKTIQPWLGADESWYAAELSGGKDSMLVSVALNKHIEAALPVYSMLLRGEMGRQQRQRIEQIAQAHQLKLHTLNAYDHPVLQQNNQILVRSVVSAFEEIYSEALEAELTQAATRGCRIMFTGIGGDELMALKRFEAGSAYIKSSHRLSKILTEAFNKNYSETNALPRTVIPASALIASAARSPVFMRKGIWPVSPLMSRRLNMFCQALPFEWRLHKRLSVEVLKRQGISEQIINPDIRENFADVFSYSLINAQELLNYLFKRPYLAQLGIIDATRLQDAFKQYLQQQDEGLLFYKIAITELMMRQVIDVSESKKDMTNE